MPSFSYKGIDAGGKPVAGVLDAGDRRGALRRLAAMQVQPLSIEAQHDATAAAVETFTASHDYFQQKEPATVEAKPRRSLLPKSRRGVALSFLQNVLMLLQSGLPLGDSLRLLHARLSDLVQRELAGELWKRISEGRNLAGSMGDFPQYFSDSHVQLVAAGEASGNLVPVMARIVAYLKEVQELQKKLSSSLAYPIFVIFVALAIVVFFLTFLLPRVRGMIETLGGQMALIPRLLIGGSEFMITFGPFLAGGVILALVGLSRWRKTQKGRAATDAWMLRLPVAGTIYLYNNVFRTSSLLGTLLDSGVNTTEALRLVERTVDNVVLRAKFANARRMIQEGVSMSSAFRRVNYMPALAMDMLTVGENTGNISSSLRNINEIYRGELTKKLNQLTTAISTIALFIAFGLVTVIALSIVMSVLDISNSLSTRR